MAQTLENYKAKLDKMLHEKNAITDILEKIEQKTGVRRLYIAYGLAVFLGIYLMVGYGSQFLCNFVGFLYPAYASLKAIETKQKDDDTKWLTYWVVYATFSLVEFFSDIFLFWIPLYDFFKCCFLVYCFAPTSWNGSITIYNQVIRPFVLRHEKKIDDTIEKATHLAGDIIGEAEAAGREAAGDAAKRYIDSSKSE